MKWLRQFRYYRQQGWGIFSAVRLTNWGIVYYQGVYSERERIIKLIRDRVAGAKEYGKTGRITAMQRDVTFEDLEAISEAIIYGINKESK